MLIQLGTVQFSANGLSYNALEKIKSWDWEPIEIIGDHPILHFSGKHHEISFEGVIWEYTAQGDPPEVLETLADKEEPVALTDDRGVFYGFFVITRISRSEKHFRARQKLGLQTEWNLGIRFYGNTRER